MPISFRLFRGLAALVTLVPFLLWGAAAAETLEPARPDETVVAALQP